MNDLEQHTDILSLIRVRMSGLSKGHKRIAEYILANYEKCAFLTAAKLGEVVGVSESTALRKIKKLVKNKFLTQCGKARSTYYTLTK